MASFTHYGKFLVSYSSMKKTFLASLEKGTFFGFQTAYAAAAVCFKLNISLDIRPIRMIFNSYNLWDWENFLTCTHLTFGLNQGHMIKKTFFLYFIFTRFSPKLLYKDPQTWLSLS